MRYTIKDIGTMINEGQLPFMTAARAQTMLRDFDKLRRAIHSHDSFAAEEAFDYCERWIDQLRVVSGNDK